MSRRNHSSFRPFVPGRRLGLLALCALALGACGGGSSPSSPSTPVPVPSPTTPPPAGSTVTLTSAGVNPKSIQIPLGGRVTFVNRDSVAHEIQSDPHPIHTDCPPINEVSGLAPGESRQTGVFTVARTCGYHDHGQPTNTLFQGTIVIQ